MAKKKVKADNSFLEVDKLSLDENCEEQATLYKEYSDMLADARREMDEAKNELEVTKAELDQAIRSKPQKFGLAKVTDAGVKACIMAQDEYQMQFRAFLDAKHRVDVLEGVTKALEHRKQMLTNLTYLHGQQYFSAPRVDEEVYEAMSERRKNKGRALNREDLDD